MIHLFTESDTLDLLEYIENARDPEKPLLCWIDLFCGCGGVTEGFINADQNSFVLACVNHDPFAIKSHHANHPKCIHYTEDIRDWRVIKKIEDLISAIRERFPEVYIGLHASLECTHFSKAKGGLARDADSRTLADHLFRYLKIKPDYVTIENVEEFLSWGPVDEDGKVIEELKFTDYKRWVSKFKDLGFDYDYQVLNAADFGEYTNRKRYFGVFAYGLPISFPEPTHVKRSKLKDHPGRLPHKPVREKLNLENEGNSIFGLTKNGKKYSLNTFSRVYYGLIKYYKEGYFMMRYNGGNPRDKTKSVEQPLGTILTNNTHALVEPLFLSTYYGKSDKGQGIHSLDNPSPVITTKDRMALHHLQYAFGKAYYSSIDEPAGTLVANPKHELVTQFLKYDYTNGGGGNHSSLDEPENAITSKPKHSLVTKKWLFDTQFGRIGSSLNKPCPTIIARQDKKPLYLASANSYGEDHSEWKEDDPFIIMLLRTFMREYGIADIKIRSLEVDELLRIQGFPEDYVLKGGKTRAMKYIGNSVCPGMAKTLGKTLYDNLKYNNAKIV